jgi:glycogen debranching enzyme
MVEHSSEWLLTNAYGGYASGTLSGINTRSYHGLLNSASITGGDRFQLLNTLEEYVRIGSEVFAISSHRYKDVTYPDGLTRLLASEWSDGRVWWLYLVAGCHILKEVEFSRETERIQVRYSSQNDFELNLRPLLSFRSHHGTRQWGPSKFKTDRGESVRVSEEGGWPGSLRLSFQGGVFTPNPVWYYNFLYEEEVERGGNAIEDLYSPGEFTHSGKEARLVAEVEPCISPVELRKTDFPLDYFLVGNSTGSLVVAGYHWFWDWCRDSMIFLPTYVQRGGDLKIAESILDRYFGAMEGGFIPTGFDEWKGRPYFTSVDSSLWAANAVIAIQQLTGNQGFKGKYLPYLVKILDGYNQGGKFGATVKDHLLSHTTPGATWMDGAFEGVYYTPRTGYAVEVNALWGSLLAGLAKLEETEKDREALGEEWLKFRGAFERKFSSSFGLCDVLGLDQSATPQIRPNMLFATSLVDGMVSRETAVKVIVTCREHLLTSFGLRTLSPKDPGYKPVYTGSRKQRDAAYHNGTVWPWLIGAYVDSCANYLPGELQFARRIFEPLYRLASENQGLVPEIFDGQSPHISRGCIAQAWSTSELMRVRPLLDRSVSEL